MYREVLEKKTCVICISKDHEAVSHLSPSFHVLAPTDLGMSLGGWRCRVWQVDLDWPSGAHQATSSLPLLSRTASDHGRQHKSRWFSLMKEAFTSLMSYLKLHLYPFHSLGVLSRRALCVVPHRWPLQFCGVVVFPSFSFQALLILLHRCVRLDFSLLIGLFLLLCPRDSCAVQINGT